MHRLAVHEGPTGHPATAGGEGDRHDWPEVGSWLEFVVILTEDNRVRSIA